MKSVGVELRYERDALSPIHEGICSSPALERELTLGGQAVDGVETITSFVDGDPAAYEPLVADRDLVREYEITSAEDGFFLYLRRELGPEGVSLLDALAQETVVVVPPIEVRADRTMRLTLVGHPDDLGAILETVPEGVSVDVLWARDELTVSGSVSDRQREALAVARELGYYEVPRRNGSEAVAAELECAVSTASELLRRGEARAVERVLDDAP
ncbi:helix-turn-helix domain-containing protein [Natronococcus jeotgali]|uniref:Bacterio-opsin activator HTH domain-containing protein n=1 Tax=Natronococcus jeotgali DSM 18795 TaxID=1227498 RepID=L9XSA4_9EURY|nr:helix-turn-helix domain-containing protein [Natronococcus jeotgali]ELY64301.1 bacterio-opsin activator HTH domain-containing protein [Natronococcus jeotgali DSM 18795]